MAKGSKKLAPQELFQLLIYILFASVIIPIIAGQVVTMEGDSTNFSATEIVVLGLITTFIVLGLVYAVVKTVL